MTANSVSSFTRPSGRKPDELRPITFERAFTAHAAGSVLVSFGGTRVLCTVSISEKTPSWLREKNQGWLTAEYGMLPSATHSRTDREAARGKQTGRTQEIQRLIGRALRASLDLKALAGYSLTVDCDVLQADGGTRTASITGAYVALVDAIRVLQTKHGLKTNPLRHGVAAISLGIYRGVPVLDLDYAEDSHADTDLNVVMNDAGALIEIQGTAEGAAFSRTELNALLDLAESGLRDIFAAQRAALG